MNGPVAEGNKLHTAPTLWKVLVAEGDKLHIAPTLWKVSVAEGNKLSTTIIQVSRLAGNTPY